MMIVVVMETTLFAGKDGVYATLGIKSTTRLVVVKRVNNTICP